MRFPDGKCIDPSEGYSRSWKLMQNKKLWCWRMNEVNASVHSKGALPPAPCRNGDLKAKSQVKPCTISITTEIISRINSLCRRAACINPAKRRANIVIIRADDQAEADLRQVFDAVQQTSEK